MSCERRSVVIKKALIVESILLMPWILEEKNSRKGVLGHFVKSGDRKNKMLRLLLYFFCFSYAKCKMFRLFHGIRLFCMYFYMLTGGTEESQRSITQPYMTVLAPHKNYNFKPIWQITFF